MANSRYQLIVEEYLRTQYLPRYFGQDFRIARLALSSGGTFEFDAVSQDGEIVVCISTSTGRTVSSKFVSGKMHKLRADMLFLLMVQARRRIILFTEEDMYKICLSEKEKGRVPPEIEFLRAEIPIEIDVALKAARKLASDEVLPGQRLTALLKLENNTDGVAE
jgi:hypothetical protein